MASWLIRMDSSSGNRAEVVERSASGSIPADLVGSGSTGLRGIDTSDIDRVAAIAPDADLCRGGQPQRCSVRRHVALLDSWTFTSPRAELNEPCSLPLVNRPQFPS